MHASRRPSTHSWVPGVQAPTSEPQATGPSPGSHSQPSLTAPSQSSSTPSASQTSSTAVTAPVHAPHSPNSKLSSQTIMPSVHAPTPRLAATPGQQALSWPGTQTQPSSTMPSQSSSSSLSQISIAHSSGTPPSTSGPPSSVAPSISGTWASPSTLASVPTRSPSSPPQSQAPRLPMRSTDHTNPKRFINSTPSVGAHGRHSEIVHGPPRRWTNARPSLRSSKWQPQRNTNAPCRHEGP